jgi:hypothetical protein
MGKSEFQIKSFLERHEFKSEMDWKIISAFCKIELNLNLEQSPKISANGINSLSFSEWYENGFGSGDIAWLNEKLVIVGACDLNMAKVEGTLIDDKISCKRSDAKIAELSKASEEDIFLFNQAMMRNNLQYGENNQLVIKRYIPTINVRVSFHKAGVRGIGVIRSVSQEDNRFELYCYHIYQTRETRYSMHEKVGPLSEYTFDLMTITERRRLENRLRKVGKSWNDKMHRIEPVEPKAKKGEKYWYISDKMKMENSTEEGKPTSHFRYLAGNYFLSPEDCLLNLGGINEMLRDFMAR